MNQHARNFEEKLRKMGLKVFICTSLRPGEDFRQSITVNAVKCKLFIPFINEQWAMSEECIFEYNCALRSYTTKRTPQFVPIIIGGFQWIDVIKYPDVYNITANTNCAVLTDNNWGKLFQEIIASIKTHPALLSKIE